ncbi:MAG: hypothetical protein R3E88_16395 [Myxococcota bacterium]
MATTAEPRARAHPVDARRLALAAAAIAIATVAVYAPVASHPFLHWDDDVYVLQNPHLREPLGLASVARAFAQPYESNWIPLTWISLHVDAALFGLSPAAFHVENALLHLATSLVLLVAFARATGSVGASAFAAGVFALHPLHVESVAWVAQRKDCLMGLFFALGVAAHFRYARAPGARRYAATCAATAAALAAKPAAVAMPLVLLALDGWPLGRGARDLARWRALAVEKLPLLALAALAGAATVVAQRNAGSLELLQIPFAWRAMNASWNYLAYLGAAVWPSGLAFYYPWPLDASLPWKAGAGLLALSLAFALAARAIDRAPALLAGLAIYVVALLPSVGFVQVGMQGRADRYMYLPLLGLALAAAFGARALARGSRAATRALAAAAVAALVAFAFASAQQVRFWRGDRALYARALAVTSGNFFAHWAMGGELERAGDRDGAIAHYREAIALRPRWYHPHVSLGRALGSAGDAAGAEAALRRAAELRPQAAEPALALAELALARGAVGEADDELARAIARTAGDERAALERAPASARSAASARPPRRASPLARAASPRARARPWRIARRAAYRRAPCSAPRPAPASHPPTPGARSTSSRSCRVRPRSSTRSRGRSSSRSRSAAARSPRARRSRASWAGWASAPGSTTARRARARTGFASTARSSSRSPRPPSRSRCGSRCCPRSSRRCCARCPGSRARVSRARRRRPCGSSASSRSCSGRRRSWARPIPRSAASRSARARRSTATSARSTAGTRSARRPAGSPPASR